MGRKDAKSRTQVLFLVVSFLGGIVVCATIITSSKVMETSIDVQGPPIQVGQTRLSEDTSRERFGENIPSRLDGLRILVAIASYGLDQLPHLEEVLDSYVDLCAAGAKVDVWIHGTHPFSVTLIDLLNSRIRCNNPSPRAGFSLRLVLKARNVFLHLVDFHRPLFYEKIDDYDLFIYSEDDIRVTPKTVSTYLLETERVQSIVGAERAADFNVGIARYEYNFPPSMVVTDLTRKITRNVTRVYWEHSWHPAIPKSVDAVPQEELKDSYVHMKNHHQGMYFATRDLLQAWKERSGCSFDIVKERPGKKNDPRQHTEGTQRVWMSSQQLYGNRHCNVQQVIPMDKFGMLTVLHLPNKNYRRHGKKGRIGGSNNAKDEFRPAMGHEFDGVEMASPDLLTALSLHIEIRRRWPEKPHVPYDGMLMIDDVPEDDRSDVLEQRMKEYNDYVARGGVMSEEDMQKRDFAAPGYK